MARKKQHRRRRRRQKPGRFKRLILPVIVPIILGIWCFGTFALARILWREGVIFQ